MAKTKANLMKKKKKKINKKNNKAFQKISE